MNNITENNIRECLESLSNNDNFFHDKLIEHEVKFHFLQMQISFLMAFVSNDNDIKSKFALFAKAMSVSEGADQKDLRDVATGLLEAGLQKHLSSYASDKTSVRSAPEASTPFSSDNIIQFPKLPKK